VRDGSRTVAKSIPITRRKTGNYEYQQRADKVELLTCVVGVWV